MKGDDVRRNVCRHFTVQKVPVSPASAGGGTEESGECARAESDCVPTPSMTNLEERTHPDPPNTETVKTIPDSNVSADGELKQSSVHAWAGEKSNVKFFDNAWPNLGVYDMISIVVFEIIR